ncbi:MAG: TolC family protein [Planctomycetia bacterium]|nr:TolC family protein [Planctomycetia bacterium]
MGHQISLRRSRSRQILCGIACIFLCAIPEWPGIDRPGKFCRAETLEDAWNVAFTQSRKLQSQESRIEAAQAEGNAARAARMPRISNTSAYIGLSERPLFTTDLNLGESLPPTMAGLFPSKIESPIADRSFAISLTTVSVPLYTGGKITGLIDAADAMTAAAQSEHQGEVHDLKLEVAETYLAVLRTQRLVEVAEQAERSLAAHMKDVDNLLAAGFVTRNASLAARVAHADSEQKVLQAQVGFQTASAAYNRLLWRPLDTPVQLEEMDIPPFTGELTTLTEQAVANRSELNLLAAQSRALQAQARVHRADRLPDVLAAAGYNYSGIQEKVNELLSGSAKPNMKSNDEIAREVIRGEWGNGQDRRNRLSAAGYNADAVQAVVNKML